MSTAAGSPLRLSRSSAHSCSGWGGIIASLTVMRRDTRVRRFFFVRIAGQSRPVHTSSASASKMSPRCAAPSICSVMDLHPRCRRWYDLLVQVDTALLTVQRAQGVVHGVQVGIPPARLMVPAPDLRRSNLRPMPLQM